MDFSVPMAIVDFIPVILFAIGGFVLAKSLYRKMRSFEFAALAAGCINVTAAGALKALWKLLYALGVCDFEKLNAMFFPLQTIGFVLAAVGLCAYVFGNKKSKLLSAAPVAAPAVYSGTMLFVVFMILGVLGINVSLCTLAIRNKKPWAVVLSAVSFVFVLGMGYLSSKDFTQAYMNWAAEIVNTVGQAAFLGCVLTLRKDIEK